MSNGKITLNIGLNNNCRIRHANEHGARIVADIAARLFCDFTEGDYNYGIVVGEYEGKPEPTVVIEFDAWVEFHDSLDRFREMLRVACCLFSQECIAADFCGVGCLEFAPGRVPCYDFNREYFKTIGDCNGKAPCYDFYGFYRVERPVV